MAASSKNPRDHVSAERRLKEMRKAASPAEWAQHEPASKQSWRENAVIDCGWGRLLFAQTFESPELLAQEMRNERPGCRDIAFYVSDPHVMLAAAPQELFLDPSHTYRRDLSTYQPSRNRNTGFFVRRLTTAHDAERVNVIYAARNMVAVRPDFFWTHRDNRMITVFVAEDEATGDIIGAVTGVDHVRAFDDPDHGSSLWCLAVHPQARHSRIGEVLVRRICEHFKARGSSYLDLSVLHDNESAIALYEKLGFQRVPVYAVKRKNWINEKLFTGPDRLGGLNPYAEIIVNEALRRGIRVDVTDAAGGFFRLTYGGRTIHCRESLSELTSGVAVSICDDKTVTRKFVSQAGVRVPAQIELTHDAAVDSAEVRDFVTEHGAVVVKPARGEQGRGVAVGLTTIEEIAGAVKVAREMCDRVLIEELVEGVDLRIIVIDYKVVAAAIRKPACIVGDGKSPIRQLIEKQSRRREAATRGEASIPIDQETVRWLARNGHGLDDVLDTGAEVEVRKTANLHTGGTIHDVTTELCAPLVEAAILAARAIDIPVTGIDLMVKSPRLPDYAFIEANERPGLANHEPQPTAERFVDLLFPLSLPADARFRGPHAQTAD